MAAFGAVKTGIAMGKDLQSMGKDLGKLWDSIDTVKNSHEQAAKGKGGPAARALDTYLATVKARDLEEELKRVILETRGMKGWNELQKIRQQVMEADRKGRAEAIARANRIRYNLSVLAGILIIAGGVAGLFYMIVYLQNVQ